MAGFIREVLLATRYGATELADAAVVLLFVPDFLANLLVGNAIAATFVPRFKQLPQGARQTLLFQGLLTSFAVAALVAILGATTSGPLLATVMPDLSPTAAKQASAYLPLAFVALPLTMAGAVTAAYLQAREKFSIPALGTFLYNLPVVAALVLLDQRLVWLAAAVVCGAGLRLASQRAAAGLPQPSGGGWVLSGSDLRNYVFAAATGLMTVGYSAVPYFIAPLGGAGELALYNYAYKLLFLPIGVCATLFTVAFFPVLSEVLNPGHEASNAISIVRSALYVVGMMAIALAAGLAVAAGPVVDAVYGHGAMSARETGIVQQLFVIGLIALPFQVVVSAVQAILYARHDTRTLMRLNLVVLALFVPSAYLAHREFGLEGLVGSFVGLSMILAIAGVHVIKWRHRLSLAGTSQISVWIRGGLVQGACFLALYAVSRVLQPLPPMAQAVLSLVAAGVAFAGAVAVFPQARMMATRILGWRSDASQP